jgi:uncharacterized phage infection (PIP) family protein YhgE
LSKNLIEIDKYIYMNEELHPKARGFSRDENLENLYESVSIREQLREHYSMFSSDQIDDILLNNESLSVLEEEVIEELFGKTKARLAGVGANLGARASNLKNQVQTGISNAGQKAGAMAGNIGATVKGTGSRVMGNQAGIAQADAGLTDVSQVGNAQAQTQDPQAAANAAKLQSILPQIKKSIGGAYKSIDSDLAALGLDAKTLAQIDPEVAKAISYAKGWLKAAHGKLK